MGTLILHRRDDIKVNQPLGGPGILHREMAAGDGAIYHDAYPVWHSGLGLSGGVGFFASLFGIGGGVIQVPMMITLLRIPLPVAVATSTLSYFVSASAVTVHAVGGQLGGENASLALLLAAGAVPGAQLGAFLARRFASTTVTSLLVAALALAASRLILRVFI